MKTNLVRAGLLALAATALLVGRAPAPNDDSAKPKKDKAVEVKKEEGKKDDGKKKEGEVAPKEKKTGIAALRQRVAELRDLAADLKKNDHDKASIRLSEIANALEADVNAMEKEHTLHTMGPAKAGAEPGREGNKGEGVGHGKPTEPGTGKPETVGPPAAKVEKEEKKKDN